MESVLRESRFAVGVATLYICKGRIGLQSFFVDYLLRQGPTLHFRPYSFSVQAPSRPGTVLFWSLAQTLCIDTNIWYLRPFLLTFPSSDPSIARRSYLTTHVFVKALIILQELYRSKFWNFRLKCFTVGIQYSFIEFYKQKSIVKHSWFECVYIEMHPVRS